MEIIPEAPISAMNFDFHEDTWKTIDKFFNVSQQLVRHQIFSYNDFIERFIPRIIKQHNPIVVYKKASTPKDKHVKYIYEFENPKLSRPSNIESNGQRVFITPQDARLKNLSYMLSLFCDIRQKRLYYDPKTGEYEKEPREGNEQVHQLVSIGRIPLMIQSKYCILHNKPELARKKMGECIYDEGGYFIINGSEKVIVPQERIVSNKVLYFVSKKPKYSHEAEINCIHKDRFQAPHKTSIRYHSGQGKEHMVGTFKVYIPLVKQEIGLRVVFYAIGCINDKEIYDFILSNLKGNDAGRYMPFIQSILSQDLEIKNHQQAIEYITNFVTVYTNQDDNEKAKQNARVSFVYNCMINQLLAHMGDELESKKYFLGMMTRNLIDLILGRRTPSNRDNFDNKRVDLTGYKLAELFNGQYEKIIRDLKGTLRKDAMNPDEPEMPNVSQKIKSPLFENGIKYSMATGNWGSIGTTKITQLGIAQVLTRQNYPSTISHLRRINNPIDSKTNKSTEPHKLNNTHYGYICPSETPEGGSIGIVKNLAIVSNVSIETDENVVREIIQNLGIVSISDMTPMLAVDLTPILINGRLYGYTTEPEKISNQIRFLRRNGILHQMVSIEWDPFERLIYVWTDSGRPTRPCYVVDNYEIAPTKENLKPEYMEYITGKIQLRFEHHMKFNTDFYNAFHDNLEWDRLFTNSTQSIDIWSPLKDIPLNDKLQTDSPLRQYQGGIIEYIDVHETNNSLIAMKYDDLNVSNTMRQQGRKFLKYTHLELHPSAMLSVLTANMPFPDHNQAPRNTFQGAMGKQAIGIYATNFLRRMDTLGHVLYYPQQPLVTTKYTKYLKGNDLPTGQTTIVAIACYTGYNQEDSLIINQSSIDRGLFRSTFYRSYKDAVQKSRLSGTDEVFCNPVLKNNLVDGKDVSKYHALDNDGFAKVNTFVDGNEVIIGKCIPVKDEITGALMYKDISTSVRGNESGYVDAVSVNSNSDGYRFCKIRVRNERIPEIGDKFCIKEESFILTENGWIQFKNLDITKNKVATLKDGILGYVYASDKYTFECDDEKLLSIQTENIVKKCTLEHKCYVRFPNEKEYRFVRAKELLNTTVYYKNQVDEYIVNHNKMATIEEYTGIVGCVEVPNTHLFYYKESLTSPPLWTGNSSRHGQKGTVGIIYRQQEMPFTKDGIVPDLIVNPHAIPSRMTIGQLFECILGKSGVMDGVEHDSTPFTSIAVEDITQKLKEDYNFEEYGNETMYNGFTGQKMEVKIFIGPTYYQRLKHMVQDKVHARASGPRQILTRQPAEGRSRDGGLRLGEMEKDCLLAHGTAEFLKERMVDYSDKYDMIVHSTLGTISTGVYNDKAAEGTAETGETTEVTVPYAYKLLTQELMSMGILPRIMTE